MTLIKSVFFIVQVLLTITIMWAICGILTATDVFPEGHPARTDVRIRVLEDAPWFRVPYPGQFGLPTITIAGKKLFQLSSYRLHYITVCFILLKMIQREKVQ
jgi:hypothetical protein